ncbi:putative glycoside hydrolase [uncultured Holdemanella sp.]|uniref:putative glycoside hydrolase n=1 Tax=uncultured Holdemanella sp. TaxID=1763549 RepID=UPI0018F4C958|nr:putative glycoside hydrolase [uncultured Holdemanella sp.]
MALLFFLIVAAYTLHPNRYITCAGNLLTVEKTHLENGEAVIEKIKIPKGTKVKVHQKQEHSSIIIYNHDKLKVKNSNLSNSFNEAIHTDYVYCRRLVNLREEKGGKLSKVVVKKGERVKVESIDKKDWDENTGQIRWYKVKKKNKTYYLSGTYVESSRKLALKKYDQAISYSTYWDDYYKDGYSKDAYTSQIDYKPIKKETYNENPMPEHVKAIHVSMDNFINNQKYIEKLKDINTIIVETKNDEGSILYASDVCKDYLSDPSLAINNAMISKKDLTKILKEYKKKGFYCVSRIVTFKDAVFAMENPKESLTDKSGNLVMYNDQYWPSAYSRKAWMYNVELAKECADLGFNEIQFDYVRFPDGTASANSKLNFHNTYKESKVAAIQGFLEYAKEELSPKHVYVAADMFAWPIVACDDQDIGQFLPAIANVVDVICPMPYLDHFSSGSFGIEDPVENPYDTLYAFTKISNEQLKSIKYPAKYRTWIQGYNMDAEDVKQEIKALKDTNYPDYMVWLASGDKKDIDKIKKGF